MKTMRRGLCAAIVVVGCLAGPSTTDAGGDESAADEAGDESAGAVDGGRTAAAGAVGDGDVELGASLAAATALALGLACVAATRRSDEPRRERVNW